MRGSQGRRPSRPAIARIMLILLGLALPALLLGPAAVRSGWAAPASGVIGVGFPARPEFRLGNEVLFSRYYHLIQGKRVGLITNQSGVNRAGRSTIDVLASDPGVRLVALFGPEHGIDGTATAGAYVESYVHPTLRIPVYSLYGATRTPTAAMLRDVEVLLYDVQDIGARTYTYVSTLNYAMRAAAQHGVRVVVLDRPNPLGGETVEAPVAEDRFLTFVGVDNLPMAHGMTAGELARFFNRKIGCDLVVVPMEGYTRDTIWQDTGLTWVQTSPNIPDLDSVFGYMATGLGEGTGIYQTDKFKWIGGRGIDPQQFASLLHGLGLPGVTFVAEVVGSAGGVRLRITDYRAFNPARTGLSALALARRLNGFAVPKSGTTPASIVMFDKIMGTDRVGQWLEQGLTPQQMQARYAAELAAFRRDRQPYLIYGYASRPGLIGIYLDGVPIYFDTAPYIDRTDRTMVPVRAVAEALGAQVEWDAARRRITITKGPGTVIQMTIGNRTAQLNGQPRLMGTAPVITNSRTMVPVRWLSEFLGAQVEWDGVHRAVWVSYRAARTP